MHWRYEKFESGQRMGIYYCCYIYVGGISDTLNYTPRPVLTVRLKVNSLRIQQLYNSPPPRLRLTPPQIIHKLFCKIIKLRQETKAYIYLYCNTNTWNIDRYNLIILHLTTQKQYTMISTNSVAACIFLKSYHICSLVQFQNQRPFP